MRFGVGNDRGVRTLFIGKYKQKKGGNCGVPGVEINVHIKFSTDG